MHLGRESDPVLNFPTFCESIREGKSLYRLLCTYDPHVPQHVTSRSSDHMLVKCESAMRITLILTIKHVINVRLLFFLHFDQFVVSDVGVYKWESQPVALLYFCTYSVCISLYLFF